MSGDDTVALQMTGVSKRFPGTLAVDSVDFEARAGEVHALMGENGAGKSTLMKILAGSFTDYTGRILIDGTEVELHSPAAAKACGIGMVYQELSLARPISIAENLLIGRLPTRRSIWLDTGAMMSEARRCVERVGLSLDPATPVEEISQQEAQLVEIARVLSAAPRVLVMDEPTSALSREEVKRLFRIVRQLKQQGLTVIYISHHLPEIFEIADRVTVLRDGRRIATKRIDELTPAALVQMMVGKTIDGFYSTRSATPGETVLEVKHLTREGFFHDVSFEMRKGEILGVAGLSGAGRTELARSLCGLDPVDAGGVYVEGARLEESSYGEAIEHGLAYLTEDRKQDGLFLRLSVKQNLVSALIPRHTERGLYAPRRGDAVASAMIERLGVVTASESTDVATLSGGNQQKVLLGKWLATQPKVLILDEPTRGVDVGAKKTIHETVMALADAGGAVVLISSDLPELVGLADRVVVMRNGHLTGEMPKNRLSEESVLLAVNGEFTS